MTVRRGESVGIRRQLTGWRCRDLVRAAHGVGWEHLQQELGFGCGCGMTCWRRLRAWQDAGAWQRLSPVDRGRRGSKQHLLVDGSGLPLAWTLTGGNRNDITQLLALLDRVPRARGRVGRPRRRPDSVAADRGYDHDKNRRLVWQRGVKPLIARRQSAHGSGLGRNRWVVERTFAWLHNRRRLIIRTDRRHETHEAFLSLACCLICWRRVETSFG